MQQISLQQARQQQLSRYFTGVPCLLGHIAERSTAKRACLECARLNNKKHAMPADKRREWARVWRSENKDKVAKTNALWRAANPDLAREACHSWLQNNPVKRRAYGAKRRAFLRAATPKWVTASERTAMRALKVEARRISASSGIAHHVDHYVPIISDFVCGLHVPWNLRIVTAAENLSKHNKVICDTVARTTDCTVTVPLGGQGEVSGGR